MKKRIIGVTPRQPTAVGALSRSALLVAPLTAAALIAQQVASNAVRDALFLTWFQVTSCRTSWPRRQSWRSPRRSHPAVSWPGSGRLAWSRPSSASTQLLFLIEWSLLGVNPRVASGLVYVHASVLGAIGISAFWSLLNERFDPHSAKALMARVAAAAAFGGLAGGVGAERVTVLLSQGALFILLALTGGACVAGSVFIGRGMPARRTRPQVQEERRSGWAEIRRVPLLRELALVVALAAALAALTDYLLKAEVVSCFGKGEPLVRFFGLFYAGTALAAFLLQALLGRADPRSDRARRLGGQPPTAGGRGRRAWLLGPGAMARHSSTRPRCDAARVNLPGRLRALLHAAAPRHPSGLPSRRWT